MSSDKMQSLSDLFPLPEGVKIRSRKFGANPATPLQPVRPGGPDALAPHEFKLRHEDKELGLLVIVQEDANSGVITAEAFSSHPEHLNQAAVSVALVGTTEGGMIRKTIPLDREVKNGDHCCSGSAAFGTLHDAVQQLGDRLGLIVFLLI
jgi:hypothetical protein